MAAGGHGNATVIAGIEVDVVATASGLAEQFQPRQLLDDLAGKTRTFADRHDDLGVAQVLDQRHSGRRSIVVDAHVVAGEQLHAVQ